MVREGNECIVGLIGCTFAGLSLSQRGNSGGGGQKNEEYEEF